MARRPIEISLFGGDLDLTPQVSDPSWVSEYGEFWVGVAALVAALIGVCFAVRAYLDTRDSLVTAQEGLRIAQKEHDAFMKQLTARADFKLTVERIDLPWGKLPPELTGRGASKRILMFRLGVQNSGNRAAGPTILNFIMGPDPEIAYWSTVNGKRKEEDDVPQDVTPTPDEELKGSLDGEAPVYLARIIERVSLKGVLIFHVVMVVDTHDLEDSSFEVRFTAQADELPDDVEDRSMQIRVEGVYFEPLI